MSKLIIGLLISIFLFSCNKENNSGQNKESHETGSQNEENETDSVMSAEESFSSAMVEEILGDNEDPDLQIYLEEHLYPLISKSGKVTIDRISSSIYLLSYEENGNMKNFILQKFYNPVKDEIFFEKTEAQTNSLKQFIK